MSGIGKATIYARRNGAFGARIEVTTDAGARILCNDTGHEIAGHEGHFTVWGIDSDERICVDVTREVAEKAIAEDWRAA